MLKVWPNTRRETSAAIGEISIYLDLATSCANAVVLLMGTTRRDQNEGGKDVDGVECKLSPTVSSGSARSAASLQTSNYSGAGMGSTLQQ